MHDLPGFRNLSHLLSYKRGLSLLAVILTLLILSSLASCLAADVQPKSPDVLVLVLNGLGQSDQVSINYSSDVPVQEARDDVDALAKQSRWIIKDVRVSSKSDATPGAKRTTSSGFSVTPLVNHADGTLPVEPFVLLLKRFKSIQINYLVAGEFAFHGLEDFENDYAKIKLSRSGNSYLYKVGIKDSGFDVLNLPRKQSEVASKPPSTGMTTGVRLVLTVGLALAAAVIAYIIATLAAKGRQSG